MNMKRNSIDGILDEMHFTDEEKYVFKLSIEYTKQEQANDETDAKEEIMRSIKELIQNEI